MCSRFLNKQTACLLENEKNPTYSHLFGTKQLLIFSKTSHLYFFVDKRNLQDFLSDKTNVSQDALYYFI